MAELEKEVEKRVIVAFRPGARVPKGSTADGIAAEVNQIVGHYGTANTDTIKTAVKEDPDKYPNIAAWLPQSDEHAWDIAMRHRIKEALRSVVRYTLTIREDGTEDASEPIRYFFSLPNPESGERSYHPLEMVVRSKAKVLRLHEELRRDADVYLQKHRRVQAEIHELLRAHAED